MMARDELALLMMREPSYQSDYARGRIRPALGGFAPREGSFEEGMAAAQDLMPKEPMGVFGPGALGNPFNWPGMAASLPPMIAHKWPAALDWLKGRKALIDEGYRTGDDRKTAEGAFDLASMAPLTAGAFRAAGAAQIPSNSVGMAGGRLPKGPSPVSKVEKQIADLDMSQEAMRKGVITKPKEQTVQAYRDATIELLEGRGWKLDNESRSNLSSSTYLTFTKSDGSLLGLSKKGRSKWLSEFKAGGAPRDGYFRVRVADHKNSGGATTPQADIRVGSDLNELATRADRLLELENQYKSKPFLDRDELARMMTEDE